MDRLCRIGIVGWIALCAIDSAMTAPRHLQFTAFDRPRRDAFRILRPQIQLAPISPTELLGHSGESIPVGSDLEQSLEQPLLVTREIPEIWEMRVPVNTDPDQIDVRIRVFAHDGRRRRMVSSQTGAGTMRVFVQPTPPRIVDRTHRWLVVRGGAVLSIRVDRARREGRYATRLSVRVEAL